MNFEVDLTADICSEEKKISAYIDSLTENNVDSGELFCTELIKMNFDKFSDRRASAALSRCLCRFLLHKKCKNSFLNILRDNEVIRTAFFGRLNTYKYSVVWILKRVIRANEDDLLNDCLSLLSENPYRDDSSKDYESRWSLKFIIEETLRAPEEYLNITNSQRKIIEEYLVKEPSA